MTTALIYEDGPQTREEAADVIRMGGVIAYRTDTYYGLGADPNNAEAVHKIRELKGREDTKPILILISDESELDRFTTNRNRAFHSAVHLYWPGPLTLVTHAREELPSELTAGTATIGVRLPADQRVRKLVRACGRALTATSANTSGQPPAFSAEEVQSYFPEGLDMIVDGGWSIAPEPSTVVDVTSPHPRVIRKGAISVNELMPLLEIWR